MNKSELQQKIEASAKPVLLDFWAEWCMPCKVTKPILEKLAEEYAGKVDFITIDADDSRDVLEQYHVRGIPTVIALRDGEEISRVTGARDQAAYRSMFSALAEGREVKVPIAQVDRILRLGAGTILLLIAINTHNWWLAGAGAIIAFLGIYDRCPIWAALTGMFKRS